MNKLKIIAIALFAFATSQLYAQNTSTGGEFGGLKNTVKQYHLTTATTTVVVAQTARLYGITYNVSNAGTTWTLAVTDGQGTPATFANYGTLVLSTVPVVSAPPQPGINMTGGIKLVMTGTPGVIDIWVAYR